ncbi:restriction endonuclease subunit S [Rothia mucilaginosa]|uniref:restriction endonuclease subunit S n=1 Tax=Rothia mucilaginosa TaxID=43675 RepID=UPI00069F2B59|nr:restriction endonuclease subunit S [Rothia mucilaginosa]
MAEVTNYIDRLVAELCPDGVEYRPLGEIVKIKNGKGYKDFLPGNIPVYGSGGVMTYVDTFAYDKPTVLIPRKGSLGNLFYLEEPFWNVDTIFYTEIDESCVIPKYLFYVLKSAELEKLNTAGGVPSLTQKVLNKVLIPVPPLEIQEAIVEILDKFTNLEAELEAELEARTLQYEYYRDSLFEALDCPRVPLDSFAKIKNGKTYKDFGAGNIPVYGSGGIMTYVDRFSYNKPTVLIPRKGSLGNLFYLEEPFWNVDTIFYTEIDEEQVIPKFLYYFLKTAHLEDLNTAGGVPSLTQKVLNKVLIPVPSLEEQQRIVDILDRFDALTGSLSEGLPAELAARRSQYEYYRDQLLTFPRKGENQ